MESMNKPTTPVEPSPMSSRSRRRIRKELRHAERRRAILAAAQRLLLSEGMEKFTVSAVAAGARVSKPAVYYYFDSKEEILGELASELYRDEIRALERAVTAAGDGAPAIEALVRAFVAHYLGDLDHFRVLYVWGPIYGLGARLRAPDLRQERDRLAGSLARRLEAARASGQLVGEVRPAEALQLALSVAHGLVCVACGARPEEDTPPLANILDTACEALRARLERLPSAA